MIAETVLSRSVRLTFAGSMVLCMQVAAAQEAQEAAADQVQKVEVTGSRIPSLSVDGTSPVTVLSARDIKIDGVRNVEDLINNLPQAFADQGSAISNGATGTSTVNLRGLTADRTLVLVNGKRLPAGSVNSSAADLNQVPAALIKRVDVLTGGAGAVYGAGAVAGVVNFILKDNFEGVEVQLNQSGYNHHQHNEVGSIVRDSNLATPGNVGIDGKIKDANILLGGNFADGRGNATLFFTYKETDAILQSARDYSSCALGSSEDGFSCSGSGTQATGRIAVNGKSGSFTNTADGGVRAYTGADAYNYGPLNYLQRPSQVYGFNAQAHFDVNDKVRVYQEFNFHNYSTDAQIAPGGIFYGQQATLSYDNPLLSSAWKNALGLTASGQTVDVTLGRRNVEGGPRISSISDTSYREVLGVKGEVSNWNYDAFAQFSRVTHQETANGYFSNARIAKALDVVADPATGAAVCRSVLDKSDLNCVPYNLYATGGVSSAALKYLQVSGQQQGYTQQIVYGGTVGSDLGAYGVKLPWASSGVGVSFGAEHRTEKLVFQPDEATISGDLSGGSGSSPPLTGSYSVKEMFGEVKVPLAQNKPFIDALELSASYRHSDYSTGKIANTYGLGLDWAPIKQVRLRGSYQRAVRAPTIQDLYNPQSVGLDGPTDDPCAGDSPSATLAQCARTGVTAAQYGTLAANSSNQYQALTGGNTTLKPEVADTYTAGIVLQPARDLTLTLDAFKIDIANTISTVDPTVALNQCLETGNPAFCNLIHRDALGSLWLTTNGYISNITENIGSMSTSGIDLGASYRTRIGALGTLDFTLNGTWVRSLTTENVPGFGEYDCAGYFGATCETPTPKWRHKFRTTWSTPWKVDLSATWRHFAAVKNEGLSDNALLHSDDLAPVESRFGARDYFDLNASYPISQRISLSGGINNLFDRDPPLASTNATPAAGTANGNTYPQVYDSMGRFFYINLTARF